MIGLITGGAGLFISVAIIIAFGVWFNYKQLKKYTKIVNDYEQGYNQRYPNIINRPSPSDVIDVYGNPVGFIDASNIEPPNQKHLYKPMKPIIYLTETKQKKKHHIGDEWPRLCGICGKWFATRKEYVDHHYTSRVCGDWL